MYIGIHRKTLCFASLKNIGLFKVFLLSNIIECLSLSYFSLSWTKVVLYALFRKLIQILDKYSEIYVNNSRCCGLYSSVAEVSTFLIICLRRKNRILSFIHFYDIANYTYHKKSQEHTTWYTQARSHPSLSSFSTISLDLSARQRPLTQLAKRIYYLVPALD